MGPTSCSGNGDAVCSVAGSGRKGNDGDGVNEGGSHIAIGTEREPNAMGKDQHMARGIRLGQCMVSGRGTRDGLDAEKTGARQQTAAWRSSRRQTAGSKAKHTTGHNANGTNAGPNSGKEGQVANRHEAARRRSGRQMAARSGDGQTRASREAARAGGAAERPWR